MPEGKKYFYINFIFHLFISFSFSIPGTEPLEEAQARLNVMQSVAVKNHEVHKKKKKNFEMAKKQTKKTNFRDPK